ncbi:hypothetical protein M1373_02115, partial [Candidatus Marsarchaeota archaeon]|nr:hypothetical protein [Candidatus Marsarchaeota archaeon]
VWKEKRKSGSTYIFETSSKWDPSRRQNRKISLFIGKIEPNGQFSEPVRKRAYLKGIKTLDEYISMLKKAEAQKNAEYIESAYEIPILKEISTDPRQGVSSIANKVGLSYAKTEYWIKKIEQKYGIHYTIEHVFLNKFGFFRFFAVAKFTGKRPDVDALKKIIEDENHIQLAFLTRGAYDFFMFFLASDPGAAENMVYALRSSKALAECPGIWYSSYFTQGIGYVPLREEFFDLMKEKVWHRSKEQPRKKPEQIFLREYATLKELNSNGMMSFSDIDKKYGLKPGSAQYTYHQLIENEMIERITLTMDNPPIKDTAVLIAKQIEIGKFNVKHTDWFKNNIFEPETIPLNKYIFEGDIGSPYGVMRIAPLYKNGDLEELEKQSYKITEGIEIESSIITDILVGKLGYRKIDTQKTRVYRKYYKALLEK